MSKNTPLRARNFPSAEDEAKAAQPHGRYDGPGSSFRMAFTDTEFLLRDELRPVRMQLELIKTEMQGASKKIKFQANGESGSNYIIRVVKNGQFTNFWDPQTGKKY